MRKSLRLVGKILGITLIILLLLATAGYLYARHELTKFEAKVNAIDLAELGSVSQRSAVLDVNGNLYSHIEGANRIVVPLDEVSPHFIRALLAREDRRFWEHSGVDLPGIARAAVTNLLRHRIEQGASTLTQQLAKNRFDLTERSYSRKVLEALLATRMEREYSKKQILEFYVNQIYFGEGYYGIETAAKGYFGKPANALTLSEGALLAGIIRSPTHLAPTRNFEAAKRERDNVLEQMHEQGAISTDDLASAKAARIQLTENPVFHFEENYALDAIRRELDSLISSDAIQLGGMKIFSSIDPDLQRTAETVLDETLRDIEERPGFPHPTKAQWQPAESGSDERTNYLQGALVAVDNATGGIRAIVGGRDFNQSKYPRALLAKRQLGSTFKPFVYTTAFTRGLLPGTYVDDNEITLVDLQGYEKSWSPKNSDGEYNGLRRAGIGLVQSRNTMTVRVGLSASLDAVRGLAEKVHLADGMPPYPSSLLGSFEESLKDLTGAYTIFPDLGRYQEPHFIERIEDRHGRLLYERKNEGVEVVRPGVAWVTQALLKEVMDAGTAAKSKQLGWKLPAGGKTGTTNDFKDAWFVGFTTSLTCGVWVGMDQPEKIMNKGYGATLALPTWVEFMLRAVKAGYPADELPRPAKFEKVNLCSESGKLANDGCIQASQGYSMSLPSDIVPRETCTRHRATPPVAAIPPPAPPPDVAPSPQPAPNGFTAATVPPPPPPDHTQGMSTVQQPTTTPRPNYDIVDRWNQQTRVERAIPVRTPIPQRAVPRTQMIIAPDGRVYRVRRWVPAVPVQPSPPPRPYRERFYESDDDDD